MAGLCFLAWALWLLGYAERARQKMDEALAHARDLDHPSSLAYALVTAAMFHQQRREVREAQEQAEAAVVLATEQQLPFWLAYANTLRGWALTAQGHDEEGMELMRQGMEAFQATGAQVWQPFFFLLQAEACGRVGQCAEGLDFLARALEAMERSGEQLVEAEVYRLRGELLLDAASGDEDAVEACYRRAIEVAQGQNARSLQLRASASLCEFLRERGREEEGRQLLGEIYGWFGEGFESADLKKARALLHGMGGGVDG